MIMNQISKNKIKKNKLKKNIPSKLIIVISGKPRIKLIFFKHKKNKIKALLEFLKKKFKTHVIDLIEFKKSS
jgi:hypothetical protein